MTVCVDAASNMAVERPAGSHPLAAAAHCRRYPDLVVSWSLGETVMRVLVFRRDVRVGSSQGCGERQEASHHLRGGGIGVPRAVALTFWDPDHSEEEDREITIGRSARQRVLFVAHAAREGRVRIISARRATRREQRQYEEPSGEATQ